MVCPHSLPLKNSFNKTEAAIFLMQAMLAKDLTFFIDNFNFKYRQFLFFGT